MATFGVDLLPGPNAAEFVLSNTILEYGGAVTTEESPSVKAKLYKAVAGEHVPVIYYPNISGKLVVVNRHDPQLQRGWFLYRRR